MLKSSRYVALLVTASLLPACGGGGSGGSVSAPPTGSGSTPGTTPAPTPVAGCSLGERQAWVGAQLKEWYLFPETLPANLDGRGYATVEDYLDGLTATARAQNRDRYFTYLTSIAEENAYYNSGASAGLGLRFGADYGARRLFVLEAFETGPAAQAGIRRGTEIVAIGASPSDLRSVDSLWAAGGPEAVMQALGPDEMGVTRALQVADQSGTRTLTVAKADFAMQPLSDVYGFKILDDGGRKVGYLNLRSFIGTADPQLRNAFGYFRNMGVRDLIVDLRYNGGGALVIADLLADLMGGARSASEVSSYISFRPEKSSENVVRYFRQQPEAIAPGRIAFIGTGQSASASEMVINTLHPYHRGDLALIGTNTYGKPVGQIARDKPECDDRLRVVALAVQNRDHRGDYYTGLANILDRTCSAYDDIDYPMGDPQEASTRAALDFIAGRSCSPITAFRSARAASTQRRDLLQPARPSAAQRAVPGLF